MRSPYSTVSQATSLLASPAHLALEVTKDQPCGYCHGDERARDDCPWCQGSGQGGYLLYRWARLLNRKLVELASRRIKRLIIEAPVRHGKSETGTKYFPAWYEGTHPDHRTILTGHTDEFIRTYGRHTRDILREHGPRLFGVQVSQESEANNRWDFRSPHQGGLIAVGVGQVPTGKGGNLIVVDDPIKDSEQANSELFRDRLWDWWRWGLRTRFEPDAVCVLIMSRWHEDDLTGRLLKRQEQGEYDGADEVDQWELLHLPALAEPTDEVPDPLGREWGEALCPERYDRPALIHLRDHPVDGVGARAFEALYQGRPTTPEGDMFKVHWWQRIEAAPWDTVWVRRWDLAATEDTGKNDPDWTAGILLGRSADGRTFVQDARRIRGSELEVQRFVRATAEEDLLRFGCQTVRMAQDPGQAGKSLIGVYSRTVLPDFDFRGRVETGDKTTRARPWAAQVEAGNVYLVTGGWDKGAWIDAFVEEHRTFPNTGAHDDQVDAAALAYLDLAGPSVQQSTMEHTGLRGSR